MSTVIEEAPPAARTDAARRPWPAVLALAGFEARRLLLRMPVLFMLAAYAVWIGWRTHSAWYGYPALQDADRATQTGPLMVGLAVLLCVDQAVLRSQRHATEAHFGVLVLEPWRRTVAHALSVVPVAAVVAVGVAVQFGRQAAESGAVGSGSVGELLVGPLSVLLFGAAGVLLARVVRRPFAVPLTVALLFFLFVAGPFSAGSGEGAVRWLSPVVTETGGNTFPADLLGRPAGWHALYLTGLALALALLAVVVAGGRTKLVTAALAGSVVLGTVGAAGQAGGVPAAVTAARVRASVTPEQVQSCARHGRSTYCAFPDWMPRTGTWARVADHVQALTGGTARTDRLLVRQRVEARYGLDGDGAIAPFSARGQVSVGTEWGGPRVPEFSAAVASVLVTGDEKAAGEVCDGRMVTIMWLALGWQSDPVSQLSAVRLDDSVEGSAIVVSQTEPLSMTAGQTTVVRELFTAGEKAVAPRVKAHWAELTAPKVTTDRVAELLGVKAPREADKCV
ncbi:ABC transporter permease [Streptomyces sp. NPDC005423]|uniref:ABC transporter permease n=1 Tax=Streptomyces sp. NPDC005423 TaxID=3155343 RepID=UPI0033A81A0D